LLKPASSDGTALLIADWAAERFRPSAEEMRPIISGVRKSMTSETRLMAMGASPMTISQPSQSQADYRKTAQAEFDLDQIMLFPTATLYGGSFDLSPSCRQAPCDGRGCGMH
jgi:hypothetical protein